jgi:hypothetical protein
MLGRKIGDALQVVNVADQFESGSILRVDLMPTNQSRVFPRESLVFTRYRVGKSLSTAKRSIERSSSETEVIFNTRPISFGGF